MVFYSLLYNNPVEDLENKAPSFFRDLNLDQVVDGIIAGRENHNLKPFFFTPLQSIDEILYRQNIFKDIEDQSLYDDLKLFTTSMDAMFTILENAEKCEYKYQKERFYLDAVKLYGKSIDLLGQQLTADKIQSAGLSAFSKYLDNYRQSAEFIFLIKETDKLLFALSSVSYNVLLEDLRTHVLPYQVRPDYSLEITGLFQRFRQRGAKNYLVDFPSLPEMNRIEANILDGVVTLYPDLFQHLDDFFTAHLHYQDEIVTNFYHEVQFYLSYLEYINPLRKTGLTFCYPDLTMKDKNIHCHSGFDLALATQRMQANEQIVCNDFYLKDGEQIIIISGPNQGGKTTFARMFGQLHYLLSLGCPIPGNDARLFLYDHLFTHFEQEENINTHHSKFEDDLFRIRSMLSRSTSNSIIILNETLSSTTLKDAIVLSKTILEKITRINAFCIWVTFIDELSTFNEKIVSMVSEVRADDPTLRTFKVIRKPSDGLAYALSIAEKYKVTYKHLKARIKF
jgi:DNA mismatch repair protein MutS